MNRVFFVFLFAFLFANVLQAQTRRVAMLEPVGEATAMQKAIIRASVAEAITNVDGYEAITRTDIDQIMSEHDFQHGGMVSDAQRNRIGQMSGAELLCVTRLTLEDNSFFVESSLIEMESGRIVRTANELMTATPLERLRDGCLQLAAKLVGGEVTISVAPTETPTTPTPTTPTAPPVREVPIAPVNPPQRQISATTQPSTKTVGGIELVYVEGSDLIAGFYIGRYEVTQAQWQAIMGSNPSIRKGDNLPVTYVSWLDAQAFIVKLNQITGGKFRLPTEAEWEFAAKGGNQSRGFQYSGSSNIKDVGWYTKNCSRPQPVGRKLPNELGIHDMSGNVWEWCQDDNTARRWFRGGSWENKYGDTSVTSRRSNNANYRHKAVGFRLAHD